MAHDKMFGICENKCLVEVSPKSKTDAVKDRVDVIEPIVNTLEPIVTEHGMKLPSQLNVDVNTESGSLIVKLIQADGSIIQDDAMLPIDGGKPTEITTSKSFTVPITGTYMLMAIGGKGGDGGNGGNGGNNINSDGAILASGGYGGKGGKGACGYIVTSEIELTAGDVITMTPGDIGTNGENGRNGTDGLESGSYGLVGSSGMTGGDTIVYRNGTSILTAQGGGGGGGGQGGYEGHRSYWMSGNACDGGDGGDGGSGSKAGNAGTGGSMGKMNYNQEQNATYMFNGTDGKGGTSYGPNRTVSKGPTGITASLVWSDYATIFDESFDRLDTVMNYDGNGRAFIMQKIEPTYPL